MDSDCPYFGKRNFRDGAVFSKITEEGQKVLLVKCTIQWYEAYPSKQSLGGAYNSQE